MDDAEKNQLDWPKLIAWVLALLWCAACWAVAIYGFLRLRG